jgi:midasin (ATPase involved in ribosome maturation)
MSYADTVLDTLAALHESMAEKILEEPSKDPVRVAPENNQVMFSDRFPWEPKFGDFPITIYGPQRPIDPHFCFDDIREDVEDAMVSIENGHNLRLVGWPGTGKTVLGEIIACLTGRKYKRFVCENDIPLDVLIGTPALKDGQTYFKEGIGIEVLREPTLVCLDEVSALGTNTYMGYLQGLLESGRSVLIKDTGETVIAHPGCVFFGADNSLGLGDHQDKFPTRNIQDISTLNRWNETIRVDYMSEPTMAKMLKNKYPKIHKDTAAKIALFAAKCQDSFKRGDIPLVFSPRQAFSMIEHAMRVGSIERALRVTFMNSLDEKSQEIVAGFMRSIW